MSKHNFFVSIALSTAITASACAQPASAPPPAPVVLAFTPPEETCSATDAAAFYPGETWTEIDPAAQGWSDAGLAEWLDTAQRAQWAAGMIVHRGRVVARFGDIDRPYDTRSIRKSVLGAVVGQLVTEDRLSLDASLADLAINDDPPLSDRERTTTVRQLLQSRGGVFRPAAFMTGEEREEMPAAEAHAPGETYVYNNWGFNALGTIVRNIAGPLDQVITTRVAEPLGMQDFSVGDVRERFEDLSDHSAYRIWMSTRDRARFGYFYLRHGCWQGRQIVPSSWVDESIYPHTNREEEDDFGYVWRSSEALTRIGMTGRYFYSRGNSLQYIMVVPEWDVVMVLTTDMDHSGFVNVIRKRTGMMPEFEDVRDVMTALGRARPH